MHNDIQIKIWDLPVRLFHWLLVGSFILAYLSEDDFLSVHTFTGYTIAGLILFRLLWGFLGTTHARFCDFICTPSSVVAYIKSVVRFDAKRYVGHNPAGGAMVIALLLSLSFAVVTGVAAYGGEQSSGPLAVWMTAQPHWFAEAVEELHEFLAHFTLLLVGLHVVGVLIASLQHQENLVRAMFTGRKRAPHQ